MPLLTKSQKRTIISALRSSDMRAVDQKYNEPARLWCNEELGNGWLSEMH